MILQTNVDNAVVYEYFFRRNQSPGREDGAESPQDISPSDGSRYVDE